MNEPHTVAVEINQDHCSRCSICHSICPYKAITRNEDTGEVKIDLQKCQVCGICYSACPANAIEIAYYDYENLLSRINQQRGDRKSDTLVLMCRGNSPATCEVEEILEDKGVNIKDYVPLRLPCAGRVPTDFIFRTLKSGIKNVVSIQCEDGFCRFKQGTKVNARRLILSRALLKQLGYDKDCLTVIKTSRKAVYETEKCVGCDKCVFICPYDAIEAQAFATPKIDSDLCVGCGACALVCPHLAIQLEGFEFDKVSSLIKSYGKAARQLRGERVSPTILVFCCQWSEFSALDSPQSRLFEKKAVAMEIPCFKALDPVHVVQALQTGFDGVMAVVCSEDDCKLEKGRDTADRNLAVLKKALEKQSLSERFEFLMASPRSVGEFNQKLTEFTERIASMPRLVSAGAVSETHV